MFILLKLKLNKNKNVNTKNRTVFNLCRGQFTKHYVLCLGY